MKHNYGDSKDSEIMHPAIKPSILYYMESRAKQQPFVHVPVLGKL